MRESIRVVKELRPPNPEPWVAVWGNASLGTEAGVLDAFACRAEAEECARNFLARHQDNPAVGAWVCYRD
jgi:hypothetical protein